MLRSYQQPAAHMLHKRVAQLECDSSDNVRPSCCYSSSSSPGCCMFDDDPATIASPSKFLSKQRSSSVVTSMMERGRREAIFCGASDSVLYNLGTFVHHRVQPADIGWPTGNGEKLSCSQAQLGQATCMAVA